MADYIASARSNYFKVKDKKKFYAFCERWNLTGYEKDELVGFGVEDCNCGAFPSDYFDGVEDCNCGAFPSDYFDEESNSYKSGDIFKELSKYLQKGEVAILMESGSERLRYITGYAVAINSYGEMKEICLNDIYKKARILTTKDKRDAITTCEY